MWLAIIFFTVILGLLAYLDTRKPKNFPPGPKWWPLLGSVPQISRIKKKTGHFILATADLAKTYGPVLGLRVGKQRMIIVGGTQAIREFLSSDDLAGRPLGEFYNMRTWGKRRGILLVDEDFWHVQRRFSLRQLREFGFGTRNMSMLLEEEVNELVDFIHNTTKNNDSVTFNMVTLFRIHILNSIWKMLAGVRYNSEDKKMKDLQGILSELFSSLTMVGAPFSHFPILKYLAPDLSGYNLYVKTHSRIWDFLNRELEHHKKTHNPEEPRDFIDVYLNMVKSSNQETDSFTEEQLVAICLDMFMAGSETTSNTLSFCFMYLILYPDVQKKAQAEIDTVVGKTRTPSLNDRPNMPYLESIVLEVLRMFSGRVFTVPHRALKDTYLCGYVIPKDTLVVASLYSCLLAPGCNFDEPEIFKPERHLKNGRISVNESFLPFGFGKHRCLGETLARANLFLFISTLLQKFDFAAVPEHPPTEEWRDGVTPSLKSFKARVIPRI